MQLGMIGLGRMGANMVRRLMRAGHPCVVLNRSPEAVQVLAKEGAAVGRHRRRTEMDVITHTCRVGVAAVLAVVIHVPFALAGETVAPPAGVQMLLPRGGIPAVFNPRFVPADRAGLPDSAWILGVAMGGEARAYSLNLLNGHEVVNDSIAGRAIAAVW